MNNKSVKIDTTSNSIQYLFLLSMIVIKTFKSMKEYEGIHVFQEQHNSQNLLLLIELFLDSVIFIQYIYDNSKIISFELCRL